MRYIWLLRPQRLSILEHDGTFTVVSSPATPSKNRKGESLGAQAKFLGCADVAVSIPTGFHVTDPRSYHGYRLCTKLS